MNRQHAIANATVLRKGKTVADTTLSLDADGKEVVTWARTHHESISLAKKHSRSLGIAVALVGDERIPA